jgi:hypothetical protein
LAGVDAIIHAGDIEESGHLAALKAIAPVTAVRGNMDRDKALRRLPNSAMVDIGGAVFYVLHILGDLDLDPAAAGFQAVVFGHTHRPMIEQRKGVWFLNPGSATLPRGGSGHSVMRVRVSDGALDVQLIEL